MNLLVLVIVRSATDTVRRIDLGDAVAKLGIGLDELDDDEDDVEL